ncbi:YtpR family tRNA-binding protein [Salinicoccus bachuensis]|uniref:YtpR family tRNA-binding protein n=1 Tax=Salinicoccus bachuensis TaxID=3136731 RepID=A0ABZ3CGU5_9STAP
MKLTYNYQHVGDVLLVTLKKAENPTYEFHEDLTVIKSDDEIIGLNIFDASKHIALPDEVNIEADETILGSINSLLESRGIAKINPDLSPKFVVGKVTEKSKHPDADKLNVCKVDVGEEELQIVCGAPNVDSGQQVVVAKVGAIMPDGLYIKPSTLRGVESKGMICSKKELNLEDDGVKGIYVLDDSYEVAQPFEVK